MPLLRKIVPAAGLLAIAAFGCAPKQETTSAAPAGGLTLDQVAQKAPAVLFFVKKDCGSNPMAIPLVQKLYAANAGTDKFYVVMNADRATADDWAKQYGTTFPIIPDPNKEIIGKYGIKTSQTGVLIDSSLNATKQFAGFGRESLEELNKHLAKSGAPAKVDLSDAPPVGVG